MLPYFNVNYTLKTLLTNFYKMYISLLLFFSYHFQVDRMSFFYNYSVCNQLSKQGSTIDLWDQRDQPVPSRMS